MKTYRRAVVAIVAMLYVASSFAAATIQTVSGDVRVGTAAAAVGQRVNAGNVVTTGPKGRVTLRFDDGQSVALHDNTEFRVVEYAYSQEAPANDRSTMELLKGAMRFVTGALGQRTPQAATVRTSHATIGIRGTDFMLALTNPLFFQVLSGVISVGNATFSAGAVGTVATPGALAQTLGALPPGVQGAFVDLQALNLAGLQPAEPPAAPGTQPAGLGNFAIPGAILIGIGAAILAGDDDNGGTPSPGTTGTPGTR